MICKILRAGEAIFLVHPTGAWQIDYETAWRIAANFDTSDLIFSKSHENITHPVPPDAECLLEINEEGNLEFYNAECFRHMFIEPNTKWLSVNEFAAKHNKKAAVVRRNCQNGRINGALMVGSVWIIPENSPYPADHRFRPRQDREENKEKK